MFFEIGDLVVHPRHGVGRIVKREIRQFEPGVPREYYEIDTPGSTLWVPVDLQPSTLRKLTAKSELKQGRRLLKSPARPLNPDPRLRQADLLECLRQGTLSARCEVVRDLTAHSQHKPLGGETASLLRMVQDVLSQEWAALEGITPAQAMHEIETLLHEGRQRHEKPQSDRSHQAADPITDQSSHPRFPAAPGKPGLHSD